MRAIVLALCIALAGCQNGGQLTPTQEQTLMTACASASASIKVLTEANKAGKLSEDMQDAVLEAIGIIDPVCGAEDTPTLTQLQQQAFQQAVAALVRHSDEVED